MVATRRAQPCAHTHTTDIRSVMKQHRDSMTRSIKNIEKRETAHQGAWGRTQHVLISRHRGGSCSYSGTRLLCCEGASTVLSLSLFLSLCRPLGFSASHFRPLRSAQMPLWRLLFDAAFGFLFLPISFFPTSTFSPNPLQTETAHTYTHGSVSAGYRLSHAPTESLFCGKECTSEMLQMLHQVLQVCFVGVVFWRQGKGEALTQSIRCDRLWSAPDPAHKMRTLSRNFAVFVLTAEDGANAAHGRRVPRVRQGRRRRVPRALRRVRQALPHDVPRRLRVLQPEAEKLVQPQTSCARRRLVLQILCRSPPCARCVLSPHRLKNGSILQQICGDEEGGVLYCRC